jgi:hypothetical protein
MSNVFNEWSSKQKKTNDKKISPHLLNFKEALKSLQDTNWMGVAQQSCFIECCNPVRFVTQGMYCLVQLHLLYYEARVGKVCGSRIWIGLISGEH